VSALVSLYLFTQKRVARRLVVTGACSIVSAPWDRFQDAVPAFLCDGSLGGLARWLRAAGYEARDAAGLAGDALVHEAQGHGLVLLTSVYDLLDRRLVRDGTVVALWVPTGLPPEDQLALVLADLGLPLREPRCMACGGMLESAAKDQVFERIPPRTARWKDDYWVCRACARLFWQGTHWERIAKALAGAAA
jgi:uncharacterized protein with PIN domain